MRLITFEAFFTSLMIHDDPQETKKAKISNNLSTKCHAKNIMYAHGDIIFLTAAVISFTSIILLLKIVLVICWL